MVNDAICKLPFTDIFSSNYGKYRLCCHTSEVKEFTVDWNMQDHDPFDFFYSDDMEKIRNKMLNGEFIKDCSVCYKKDAAGHYSDRKKHNDKWKKTENVLQRSMVIKLTLWGNYCNLSCAMCHPVHSSTRTTELKKMNERKDEWSWKTKKSKISNKRFLEIRDDIITNIDIVESITISTDGEPLLNPKMYEFLSKVPDLDAKEIYLTITTNLSEVKLNQYSLQEIASKFPLLKLRVSADHIYEKYNWIRYPGNFNNLCSNLERFSDLVTVVAPAVSILNIDELLEIKNFYNSMGFTCLRPGSYSVVSSPKKMSANGHSNIQGLIKKYSEYEWASPIVYELKKQPIDEDKKRLIKYLDTLSLKRGDWRKLWNDI
jgi:wyosine [tRNA(Phe)-imidazoG37] synthetase (radical SAM superfamily)